MSGTKYWPYPSSNEDAKYTATKHRSIWRTAASLSPTSPLVSDCAQHIVASWMYHVINAAHSVVARFLSPDQSSGTRFQMNWETTLKTLALGAHWKHCFSVSISVFSALEVYLYTTMRYINWHFTYLLTYCRSIDSIPMIVPYRLRNVLANSHELPFLGLNQFSKKSPSVKSISVSYPYPYEFWNLISVSYPYPYEFWNLISVSYPYP